MTNQEIYKAQEKIQALINRIDFLLENDLCPILLYPLRILFIWWTVLVGSVFALIEIIVENRYNKAALVAVGEGK